MNLSGTGLLPLGFSPAKLDFGSVSVHTTSSSKSVTLTNNQTTALAISSLGVTGNYSRINNCPPSLAAGASCQVSVQFGPALAA